MRRIKRILGLLIIGVLVPSSILNAATRTASATGNWSNTATWGGASAPIITDDVIINSGVTVTIDVASAQCASLTFVANTVSSNVNLGTNSLTVTGLVFMPRPDRNSRGNGVTVNAGTFTCGSLTMEALTGNRENFSELLPEQLLLTVH